MNSYTPDPLPLPEIDYRRLFSVVGDANAELARYDGLLQGIVNPEILLSPLTTQEAVLSSRIEGTQATVDEVLEPEAGLIKEGVTFKDVQEIINYRKALISARDHLRARPITLSLIRELHKILLDSARGREQSPGEFRLDQNWIGLPGSAIQDAIFVPPSPFQLSNHLESWEKYMNFDDCDFLLQTSVVHAQFELIHPFKDGNGLIGRILIPLLLYQKRKLSQPMFYLSAYLERNRELYYSRLRAISQNKDWNGWIEFFLKAIIEQAKENISKVTQIMALYEEMKSTLHELTHSQYNIQLLDAIFSHPIFQTTDFITRSGIHKPTAMSLLRQLKNVRVLVELRPGSGRRAAVLCFPRLLNITEGKNLFPSGS